MPLKLNPIETARPKEFAWDPLNADEANEIMRAIEPLLKQGYKGFMDLEGGSAVLMPPPLDEDHFMLRVLTENGDDRLVWNRRSLAQIEDARKTFNEYLAKGYKAYVVRRSGGSPGAKILSFDSLYEEVVMVKGRDGLLVPPIIPG